MYYLFYRFNISPHELSKMSKAEKEFILASIETEMTLKGGE
jgi:hypothetical protein